VDALYAPRRTVLDPILIEAAEEAGVQTEFEVRMTDLLRDDEGRVTGIDAADASGARFTPRASLVIGADGKQSSVARRVNASVYRYGSWSGGLICAYWSDVEVDGYEWFFRRRRQS
jgi:flavin-dependent dehydrogenase